MQKTTAWDTYHRGSCLPGSTAYRLWRELAILRVTRRLEGRRGAGR